MINITSKQYRIQMEEAHDYDQKVYGMFERQEGMFQQEDEATVYTRRPAFYLDRRSTRQEEA